MSNVTTTNRELKGLLDNPIVQDKIKNIVGKNIGAFTTSIVQIASQNEMLAKAEPNSILGAALTAATLNLPLNNAIGQAYIVPFNEKQKDGSWKTKAQFILGYKGLKQLAIRSGQYKHIYAKEVYEGQKVEDDSFLGYHFDWRNKESDKVIGYASYYRLLNGFESILYMSNEELTKHGKQFSQTFKKGFGLWKDSYDKMALKGLDINTKIITPEGFKLMGDLKVGDTVYDIDGNETKIDAVSDRKHLSCYKVVFANGQEIVCDEEHDWIVRANAKKQMIKGKNYPVHEKKNVKEIFALKNIDKVMVTIPTVSVEFKERDLPIDPYLLGYWIGNGSRGAASISTNQTDVEFLSKKIKNAGFEVKATPDKRSNAVQMNVSRRDKTVRTGGLKQALKDSDLLHNKHIPDIYKFSSQKQRLELIRGLFDADGTCGKDKRGRISFGQIRENIVKDTYEILCSLGEAPNMMSRMAKGFGKEVMYYSIQLKPVNNLFEIPRKADNFKPRKNKNYWSIKAVEKIDPIETVCIAVDSPKKSFLASESMIPTHNTVTKLHLNSGEAPLSLEMKSALETDQAVNDFNEDEGTIDVSYPDNETPEIDSDLERQRILVDGAETLDDIAFAEEHVTDPTLVPVLEAKKKKLQKESKKK